MEFLHLHLDFFIKEKNKTPFTHHGRKVSIMVMLLYHLFCSTVPIMADDGIWVEKTDESKTGFIFSEEPIITFHDDELVITTSSSVACFPIDDIRRLSFGDVSLTGIDEITTGELETPIIHINEERVMIGGLRPGTAILAYSTGGNIVARTQADKEGNVAINLSSQPKGVYIISTSFSTFKIEKK